MLKNNPVIGSSHSGDDRGDEVGEEHEKDSDCCQRVITKVD